MTVEERAKLNQSVRKAITLLRATADDVHTGWERTPAGGWMAENAYRYGFVLSYPRDSRATTCYSYEPWHFRYVGPELAQQVQDSGLTLREFLWQRLHEDGTLQ